MAGEKTEKPTPKRRHEAQRRGQIARSAEVGTAAVLFAGIAVLAAAAPRLIEGYANLVREGLQQAWQPDLATEEGLEALADWGLRAFVALAAPVAVAALVAGVLAGAAQTRLRLAPGALKPSLKKLNPLSGLKRIFGPNGVFEALKAIAKTGVVALVVFLAVWPELPRLASLVGLSAGEILQVSARMTLNLALKACAALALIAAADFLWQRRRNEKSLRMTVDELRRELKQTDLAPEVKRQVKRRQLELARRRMMTDVPTADVVVTNPTHYAVALRYDGKLPAPQVVARGVDHVAAAIRALAEEHGVPIISNPPLARSLYRDVPLGAQIPEAFFHAVAEVLAFVFRTSGRRRRRA